MRLSRLNIAGLLAVATGLALTFPISTAVRAQAPQAPPKAAAKPEACGPGAIGVSRVVEIDTGDGPQLGQQQYKFHDFLEPGEVVLTFDDGPLRPYTTAVLNALSAHCAKATFFNVGKMALADPDMVREIERRGHTLGSHTWSHRNLRAMAPALAKGEVELGFSAVSKAAGHPIAPFFRFPYLSDSRAMIAHLKSRHMGMFSIEVDGVDYRTREPARVHANILSGLKEHGKGILLFHDIQPSTAGALKGILDALAAKGFKVVHLVPKAKATTLPEYDAIAEQQFNARRQVAAANPLADRSIVWPNAAASALPDEALAETPKPRLRSATPPAPRTPGLATARPVGTATTTAATPTALSGGQPGALIRPGTTGLSPTGALPPGTAPPPAATAALPPPQAAPPRPPRQAYSNPDPDDWRYRLFNRD